MGGHPGGNPGANIKSITHRCYIFEVAFVWELTKETIHLPLGCLQGGLGKDPHDCGVFDVAHLAHGRRDLTRVLKLRTTISQKCEAVPRRARV